MLHEMFISHYIPKQYQRFVRLLYMVLEFFDRQMIYSIVNRCSMIYCICAIMNIFELLSFDIIFITEAMMLSFMCIALFIPIIFGYTLIGIWTYYHETSNLIDNFYCDTYDEIIFYIKKKYLPRFTLCITIGILIILQYIQYITHNA